jgi:preprotein translocase subunit YajC
LNSLLLAFQAVPPASDAPAQSQTVQPTESGHAEQSAPSAGFSGLLPLLIFIPFIFFIMWQSRSQQKKQEATIASLKKGDKVITQSGIVGRLGEVDDRYARVEIAPGVKIQVLRSSLTGRDTGEASSGKSADKSAEAGSDKQ